MQMSMKNLSFQLQPVKSKSRMVKGLIIQLLVLGQNVPHTFTFLQEFGSVKFTNIFFFFFSFFICCERWFVWATLYETDSLAYK